MKPKSVATVTEINPTHVATFTGFYAESKLLQDASTRLVLVMEPEHAQDALKLAMTKGAALQFTVTRVEPELSEALAAVLGRE